jgi:hypothetical protein
MSAVDEVIRKRYRYRRLILTGKLRVRSATAAKLIGPDCAYHLYATLRGQRVGRRE